MIHYYLTIIENRTVSNFFCFYYSWHMIQFKVPMTKALWVRIDFLFRHREHRVLVMNYNAVDG